MEYKSLEPTKDDVEFVERLFMMKNEYDSYTRLGVPAHIFKGQGESILGGSNLAQAHLDQFNYNQRQYRRRRIF
jgi:hypothetical protein